jgi:hypothetical protein
LAPWRSNSDQPDLRFHFLDLHGHRRWREVQAWRHARIMLPWRATSAEDLQLAKVMFMVGLLRGLSKLT